MLCRPTIDILQRLRLFGMAKAFQEQMESAELQALDFTERFGLIVDREQFEQENRKLTTRLRRAHLGQSASFEDLDLKATRGLDKGLMSSLASCAWIRAHNNLLVTGPTGVGKSYLACALGHKACREGFSVVYHRAGRLFYELGISRGEGRYLRLLKSISQVDLLILDDWGLVQIQDDSRRDMLEILEERHNRKSTIIASQLPVENWHELIGEPTLADAILDRLVHNAYKIALKGDSMRKNLSKNLNLK